MTSNYSSSCYLKWTLDKAHKHIMVADDDIDDIEMFMSAVNECATDTKVSTATDGQQLINLLQKEPVPDVIVLDLNMPRLGGIDCLKAIRKDGRYKSVPVIILSTSNRKRDIDNCLDNGADCYVVKPSSYNRLKTIVRDMCKGIALKKVVQLE